jgi:hypothetical protein
MPCARVDVQLVTLDVYVDDGAGADRNLLAMTLRSLKMVCREIQARFT